MTEKAERRKIGFKYCNKSIVFTIKDDIGLSFLVL